MEKLICADLAGTIIKFPDSSLIDAWIKREGYRLTEFQHKLFCAGFPFAAFVESPYEHEIFRDVLLCMNIDDVDDIASLSCKMFERAGNNIDYKSSLTQRYIDFTLLHVQINDVLISFLKEARKNSKIKLVSNLFSVYRQIIEIYELDRLFDNIILSCEIGSRKPDDKIFSLLEDVPYSSKIFIGDDWNSDIIPALSRSYKCLYITDNLFITYATSGNILKLLKKRSDGTIHFRDSFRGEADFYLGKLMNTDIINIQDDIYIEDGEVRLKVLRNVRCVKIFMKEFNFSSFLCMADVTASIHKPPKRDMLNCSSNELQHSEIDSLALLILKKLAEKQISLNKYVSYSMQMKKFSRLLNIPEENLQLFAGSDDAVKIILSALSKKCNNIIIQFPNYEGYENYASLNKMCVCKWHLREDMRFHYEDGIELMMEHPNSIIVIASPNGYTGILMQPDELIGIICAAMENNCIVILDETYAPFSGICYDNLVQDWDNLIVIATFSKGFALAGIRFAYTYSSHKIANYLAQWNGINNISVLSCLIAEEYLNRRELFAQIIADICEEREQFRRFIIQNTSWLAIPSSANFQLIKHTKLQEGTKLTEYLSESGIIIKSVEKECLSNCTRITILEHEPMSYVMNQILSYLRENEC